MTETVSGGVRNSSWHFFFPPVSTGSNNPANTDPGCPKQPYSCSAASTVTLQTGSLVETHDLVQYQSLGQSRGLTLTYESERANPSPIFHVGYESLNNSFSNLRMTGSLSFPGLDVRSGYQVSTLSAPGLPQNSAPYVRGDNVWNVPPGQDSADGAMQVDLTGVETGIYSYIARTKLITGDNVLSSAVYSNPYVHVNSTESVFGSGWGLSGLREAHVAIASIGSGGGSASIEYESDVLIVDGNGSEILYTGGTMNGIMFQSPPGDFSTLQIDRVAGTLIHLLPQGDVHTYRKVPSATGGPASKYRIESKVDRNGNTTQYKYENAFGITSIIDPVGLITRFDYMNGKVARIIDPAGRVTDLTFNGKDLTSIADPDGSTRSWSYDGKGSMIGETTKRGFEQVEQYDSFGRITGVIREDGTTNSYRPLAVRGLYPLERTTDLISPPNAASQESNNTYYIDAKGNVITADVDTRGQSVGRRDSLGNIGLTIRDENNNVISRFDARDNPTSLKYDSRGNVIEISDALTTNTDLENPTITWTGETSNLWNEPANWSDNRIPTVSDDVLIPADASGSELLVDRLNTTVRRLFSFIPIRLNSSRLTVLGDSRLMAGYNSNASFLTASGRQASLTVQAPIVSMDSELAATSGGRVVVRGTISAPNFQRNIFVADGSGSLISLPSYIDEGRSTPINFTARNSGTISMAALSSLRDSATLTARTGGTIDLPSVTQMTRTGIELDADSFLYAPQWRELSNGVISVNGVGEKSFPSLTSIDASSLFASGGAKLELSGITAYQLIDVFSARDFRATGLGSEVRFPNLVSISGSGFVIRTQAYSGGLVSFPKLTDTFAMQASSYDTGSRVEFPALVNAVNSEFVMSAGSQITLPNLVTLSTNPGSGSGALAVGGSGILDLPKLTSFESIAFAVSDSSRINVPLLTRLKNSTVSVSGEGVFPFGQLTSIDSSSIFASGGAKLELSGITAYQLIDVFSARDFRATGLGSEVRFPNLVSISGSGFAIRTQAYSGGLVSFPKLTDTFAMQASSYDTGSRVEFPALVNAVDSHFVMSRGSQITLPNLVTLSTTPGNGGGSFAVDGSGVLDLPRLASNNGLSFSVEGNSPINVPLLTDLQNGSISVTGSAARFPIEQLTSVNATSIFAAGGAKLELSGITSYQMNDGFGGRDLQGNGRRKRSSIS